MADKQWYKAVQQPMTKAQKTALLKQLQSASVLNSLRRPEMLMDFFTDCLSTSDLSLAVLALSGLFQLIISRNLDYPDFYTRLYALLDSDILHSKYRSRFLRHLDTFLAPTNHLPAATIASFIKRMARRALFGPPAAIVAVIPLIYNLLKEHPTCTFMLHRHPHPPYTQTAENIGVDPYDPDEPDPQKSNAIHSSLWELETLQSHYHPTVASIARIISEQFTKQQYNIEDFLDHGYITMLESELKKESKRPPVVEYRIPKRIFGREDGEDEKTVNDPLLDLWEFS